MKFGIAHHTTGQFRKGTNRNTAAIADEMPFGLAFCLAMISTECRGSPSYMNWAIQLDSTCGPKLPDNSSCASRGVRSRDNSAHLAPPPHVHGIILPWDKIIRPRTQVRDGAGNIFLGRSGRIGG